MGESNATPLETAKRTVVVLGGYGNFGARIVAALAREAGVRVLVAGRDATRAQRLAQHVGGGAQAWQVDHQSPDFAAHLRAVSANVLVHTAGPFQGQGYQVARDCIAAGCHYVDIADGREFVAHIDTLDAEARAHNVLVVSGASSLPALSSAVVDRYRPLFARIDTIEHAISSGAKPPGLATMQGVMSYVGKPFQRWQYGTWCTVFGWQDLATIRFPAPVGRRWVASCDVPDLALFPARYAPLTTVLFRAGVGFASTTLTVWALSWLVRARVLGSMRAWSRGLHRVAQMIEPLGTQWSAMQVLVKGLDHRQQALQRRWILLAGDNHGPHIPCLPAIALTRKLLRDDVAARGALPCMGLLTVEEILSAQSGLNLRVSEE